MLRFLTLAIALYITTGITWADGFKDAESATAALNDGNNQLAIELYTKALEDKSPLLDHSAIYANRGVAHENMGHYEKTLEDYNRALELNDKFGVVYGARCILLAERFERYDEAQSDCDMSVALNHRDAGALYGLGYLYEVRGNLKEAEQFYKDSLSIDPNKLKTKTRLDSVRILMGWENDYKLAVAAYDAGDFSKAVDIYTDLLVKPMMEATLIQLYFGRGISYERLGKIDQALADFDWIISRNQSIAQVYQARCITYTRVERYSEAIADCTQAEQLDSTLVDPPFVLGFAYEAMGQKQEAEIAYQRALKIKPDHEESLQGLQRLGP